MSARGMSARGLRAFLLVSAFFFGSNESVSASDTVNLTFANNIIGQVGSAGKYTWTKNSGTGAGLLLPGTVETFCISETTVLNNTGNYTLTNAIDGMPTPVGGMGLAKARQIAILINEVMNSGGTLTSHNTATGNANTGFAGVQNAIWDIISGATPNALATAAINIYNSVGGNMALYYSPFGSTAVHIHGLDSYPGGQDQIYWSTSPNFIIQAPVPTGVVMAGMGIVCLGGVNFLRRRKTAAAV